MAFINPKIYFPKKQKKSQRKESASNVSYKIIKNFPFKPYGIYARKIYL